MKILYILKHNPWGIGGGCFACRNYLQLFTTIFSNAAFDVCICEEYLEAKHEKEYPMVNFIPVKGRSKINKYLIPFTGVLHRHNDVAKHLLSQNKYDYCIFDHNSIAGSIVGLCKKIGVKTIVLNHNFEYDYFRDNNSKMKCLLLLPQVKKNEKKSYLGCDYNIFLTEEDKEQFAKVYGKSQTVSIVGGCFNDKNYVNNKQDNPPLHRSGLHMVISGSMCNVQNLDGINYFLDELYPLVPRDISIVFTGKNPSTSLITRINELSPRVTLKANPQDIDSIVSQCDIFLCPARLGGGMKLRVMDGLRNGLPVLAHEVSARGYRDFEKKGILYRFTDKEDFFKKLMLIVEELHDAKLSRDNIMITADEMFSFDAAVKKIKSYL